jgi:FKBP-type peptidyl-prolyl cis-trans isomerase
VRRSVSLPAALACGLAAASIASPAFVRAATPAPKKPHGGRAHAHAHVASGPKAVTLPDGLKEIDTAVGKGAPAKAGDVVHVHYVGTLMDGLKFDSSRDRNEPFTFNLGAGDVIKGWDEGIVGMRPGGKRTLIVPPDLGYGARGTPGGPIPPNATLRFDVELLSIGG